MLKSYVGIATQHGLEVFLPEREQLVRSLERRFARARGPRAVCYWAVVDEDIALEVARQLEEGDRYGALVALDRGALELGPILQLGYSEQPGGSRRLGG